LEAFGASAVPPTKLIELQYQSDRLNVVIKAHRQDLHVRQLTPAQIAEIEKGNFVTEIVIRMPERVGHLQTSLSEHEASAGSKTVEYEVQELKVNLGDHVQAGQMLAYVADHRRLYIEGRALKQEAKQLSQAAKEGWPVEVEFTEDDLDSPGERLSQLTIEFLGPTMDASGLTLPVYVPFDNPMREYKVKDKTYRAGQFRPGQKANLKVAVARVPDVFVLPVAAVAREGPEAYVFRQNGDVFDRKAVHILYEDFDEVVIANDGSIIPGVHYVAQNGAAALNRVLKASQADGPPAPHDHAH
jgi:multidrug efflux pump subunit AcrA (membrane-fusion protein)